MAKRMLYEIGRAVRETAHAIDRIGLRALEKPIFKEPFARHRTVMNVYDLHPSISNDVFVAPNAAVIGDVTISRKSSVMYGAVIRGDLNQVSVGAYSTIGDRAVIHTTRSVEGHVSAGTTIGDHVIVGPGALLQSCTVEDRAVIGAGAIVMEGALVEASAHVAEGAVVHPGRRIPAGQLWAGNPAVYVRDLTKSEIAEAEGHAEEASETAEEHAHEFLPFTTAYQQAEKLGVVDERIAAINAEQAAYEAGIRAAGTSNVAAAAAAEAARKA